MGTVQAEIERRLREAFQPTHLSVSNDSGSHAGHMGDDGTGESHFSLTIAAPAFAGMNRVQRQRAVNAALGDLMRTRIHALSMTVRAPGEGA